MKLNRKLTTAVLSSTLFLSPISHAQVVLSTVQTNQPFCTSAVGNVEITSTGQQQMTAVSGIAPCMTADAITIDSASATVTLDPSNIYPQGAILTSGAGGNGINVTAGAKAGTAATINIGVVSGITSVLNGILVANTPTSIANAGTITGNLSGINIAAGGTGATIANSTTGLIAGTNAPTILLNDTSVSVVNAGVISAVGQDAIQVNQSFTMIANSQGGVIETTGNSAAIDITGATAINGTINNAGLLTVAGVNVGAVYIQNIFNGMLTNASTGVIQTTNGGNGNAIVISASYGGITNAGSILAKSAGDYAINVLANSPGTITNTGLIQSNTRPAIILNASTTGITNTGTIQSTNLAAASGLAVIQVNANGVVLLNGITNNGNIINTAGNADTFAIDLANFFNGGNIPLTQNAGLIDGDVRLAPVGGNVFFMNGGIIDGNVIAASVAVNTLALKGGEIADTVTLGGLGDTVNLSGTLVETLNGGAGNDTVNASGGNFAALDGKGGANILNVIGTFSPAGTITNMQTITVQNAGTVFTSNAPITNLNTQLTINAKTSMFANANVTGTGNLLNNGTLAIAGTNTYVGGDPIILPPPFGDIINNGNIDIGTTNALIGNTFTQNAPGALGVNLSDASNGTVTVYAAVPNAAVLSKGSYIVPKLQPGLYPAGTKFDIVLAPNGGGNAIMDNSTIVQPTLAIISFTKGVQPYLAGQELYLEILRASYSSVALNENAAAVASVLDSLLFNGTTNPTILAVITQLDTLPSALAVTQALNSLTPSYNYSLVAASHVGLDNTFNDMQTRLEDLHGAGPIGGDNAIIERDGRRRSNGMSYGDSCYKGEGCVGVDESEFNRPHWGSWGRGYGTILSQQKRQNIDGFIGDGGGAAFGVDLSTEYTTVGIAASYTRVQVKDKTPQQDTTDVTSYEGYFYGWFEPMDSWYVDLLLGVSANNYTTNRYIDIGTFSATSTASFAGYLYGAQLDTGYLFRSGSHGLVAPIARAKYTYLEIGNYTEKGAGGISLGVKNEGLNQTILGGGLRLALEYQIAQGTFVPELSGLLLYDFSAQPEVTISNFIGGGSAFVTNGIKPQQASWLLGVGLNGHTPDNYIFTAKFEMQLADDYLGYYGYLQLHYRWN